MSGKDSIPDPPEVPYYDYDTDEDTHEGSKVKVHDEVDYYHVKNCDGIPCFLRNNNKYYKCTKEKDGWKVTNEIINVSEDKIKEKFDHYGDEIKEIIDGGGIHKRKSKKSKRNGSRKSKTTKPRKTKKRSKRKKNSTSRKKSSRKRV